MTVPSGVGSTPSSLNESPELIAQEFMLFGVEPFEGFAASMKVLSLLLRNWDAKCFRAFRRSPQ